MRLGCKSLCFWSSVRGFLVCSHFPFSLSLSLSLFLLQSFFVSLLRTATFHHLHPSPQLGLGLLLSALLGCLSWTEDPEPANAAWLFFVLVFRLLSVCLLFLLSLVVSLGV